LPQQTVNEGGVKSIAAAAAVNEWHRVDAGSSTARPNPALPLARANPSGR
jgi:hypothetical protein